MTRCLLGIGSNLGDRAALMNKALSCLHEHDELQVLADSGWTETAPVGGPEKQLAYLNGAILVETGLPPVQLLETLLGVERQLGRERDLRWGPRSVDLDLLLFGDQIVDQPGLTVPHPWMAVRRFVMDPAEVVAAEMIHPVIGWTLGRLAENLRVRPLLVAINGVVTAAQVAAFHRAARACDAYVASDAVLKQPSAVTPGSAVSNSSERLKSAGTLWAATQKKIRAAETGPDPGCDVIIFDWSWRPKDAGKGDDSCHPNLLIDLAESPLDFDGPTLALAANDTDRLQHDVTAAIQGMQ